jgi:hypothetical protein
MNPRPGLIPGASYAWLALRADAARSSQAINNPWVLASFGNGSNSPAEISPLKAQSGRLATWA